MDEPQGRLDSLRGRISGPAPTEQPRGLLSIPGGNSYRDNCRDRRCRSRGSPHDEEALIENASSFDVRTYVIIRLGT